MIEFSWTRKTTAEPNRLWLETFQELQKLRREYIDLLKENTQLLKENKELMQRLKDLEEK
jgi:regulator of replication initiation timing